ncbi:MAG: hypothetical protein GY771_13990, partial [bacterium]|nr:hypothetical protein [bacterium]
MTLSLKTVAANCLSITPSFSVISGIFGYKLDYGVPKRTISLKRQLELIQGPSLDINLILVGPERFTEVELAETQYAVQFARDIYAKVDLGVRKINWQYIPMSEARRYMKINSSGEAEDLTDDWNGPKGALDVFVVRIMTHAFGADGVSDVSGPCSKDHWYEMTGS